MYRYSEVCKIIQKIMLIIAQPTARNTRRIALEIVNSGITVRGKDSGINPKYFATPAPIKAEQTQGTNAE